MVARGWLDRSAVESALFSAANACGLNSDDGTTATRQTIRSGFDGGLQQPHDDLPKDDRANTLYDLAKLDGIEYDRQRTETAKRLGVRVSTLDAEVATRRDELKQDQELAEAVGPGFLQPIEPWPEPVRGDELLTELRTIIERHVILSKKGSSTACALWALHAHAHDAADISPILFITSPTKRCGKTNLLKVLGMLVPKPLSAANVTAATVFRAIDLYYPTLLIDEVDTFVSDESDLRGVLNSGHSRATAFVLRCVGDALVPKPFGTWAPKTFAGIGRMPPTPEDRSITIGLKRKLKTEQIERIPRNTNTHIDLRRKCARWAEDNMNALTNAKPKLPPELHDRAKDNWEPLLAIAELCGGDWPEEVRNVAVKLSGFDDDETLGIQLLEDLRWLFERERCEARKCGLSSQEIAHALQQMEDRPWPEVSNGKPITTRGIAKLLKPWNIFPRQVKEWRTGKWGPNGYEPRQFKVTFKRYLEAPEGGAGSSEPQKIVQKQQVKPKKIL